MAQQENFLSKLIPLVAFVLLAVGLVAVNVFFAFIPLRADITSEGLFTLSKGSRQIVSELQDQTTIKLYFSAHLEELPVSFKTYSAKVIELLREYVAESKGKLSLEIFDPKPDTDEEEWASRYNLVEEKLPTGNSLYFGMVILSAEREEAVGFFHPSREKFLEYDISRAIARAAQPKREKLGVLSSLPITGAQGPMGRRGPQEWAFISELRKEYDLEMLSPQGLVEVPADIKVVLVFHPKGVTEQFNYALDQFLMRGGKLLVMVDSSSKFDPAAQQRFAMSAGSNLKKLFSTWGIQFDETKVLGDLGQPTRVNSPQAGVVDYPIWVTVGPKYMSRDSVITGELEGMVLIEAGAFSTKKDFAYDFKPLLRSSTNAALIEATSARMLPPGEISKSIKPDGKEHVTAALVTGKFKSAYPAGRPVFPKPPPGPDGKPQAVVLPKQAHLSQSSRESSVILVGDTDFVADQFSIQKIYLAGTMVAASRINDNLNFVFNAVDFLAGSQKLIHVRSRGKFSRPFTRVSDMQLVAAKKFAAEEKLLTDRLQDVKKKLQALEKNTPAGQRMILTPEQLEAVKSFRQEEKRTKKALREVRRHLRQNIEALGNNLLVINLLGMPFLVALVGFWVIFRRGRRRSGGKQ